jgi:hypothetical protein
VGRVALVAWALAAAGCRQLFGIDDTAVAPDAAPDAFTVHGLCATPHLVCADFDSPQTGLALFTQAIEGGTVDEQASVFARSVPNVLVTALNAGSDTGTAVVGRPVAVPLARVSVRAWIGASGVSATCEPYVVSLALTSPNPNAPNAILVQLASQTTRAVVAIDGSFLTLTTPPFGPTMRDVLLTVDLEQGALTLGLDDTGLSMTDALLVTDHRIEAISLGISVAGAHTACEVRFDDVLADPLP